MSSELQVEIEAALAVVQRRIDDHHSGKEAPFSDKFLAQVKDELRAMSKDPGCKPQYPRFLLDWPDETGLKTMLMDLAYRFSRLKKT